MQQKHSQIFTIAQLTKRIKNLLEGEVGVIWVSGEISNFRKAASGHAYFTLKDAESQLDAVMFKGRMSRMKFEPESGMEVLARGAVTVYARRGNYQLVVEELQPKGLGALQLAYEKLKKKLELEGLFEAKHKKKLPLLPRRIGVVTSPTGAAFQDILNVIKRRFANVHILLYPARVQGEGAAVEIAAGVRTLDAWGVDVMIVGRGGGSLEDLWSFNEEDVARAVFAAKTPVISAVGHEIDFALTDFVADMRAPTPSAAAELVVREQQALTDHVLLKRRSLERAMRRIVEQAQNRFDRSQSSYIFLRADELLRQQRQILDECRTRLEESAATMVQMRRQRMEKSQRALTFLSPQLRLQQQVTRLETLSTRLRRSGVVVTERKRNRFSALAGKLNSLSPVLVLARGYALAWKQPEHQLMHDASQLEPGDQISLWLGSGTVQAEVKHIDPTGGITNYDSRKKI
ncbi:MAG: exodeoxyribonuclease VII large subunit [Candidatus Hydrogenedentes bacterium]|nr:exodeoxyribonuclease VII large subunit [Candidatus Hydrogenedentota bacterium]